jgi:hypothetical protein
VSAVAARGRARPRGMDRCTACGASGRRGQLICLGCGERMALRHRDAPGWRPAAFAAAALVLAAGSAVGLVIGAANGGREGAPSADSRASERAADARERARAEAERRVKRERARRARAQAVGDWPAGRSGYTVVLLNTGDRASAERFARGLTEAGEDAGVLSAEDHPNLGGALFLAFAGVYSDEAEAAAAATRLRESYPGAYPQFVEAATGSSSGRPAPAQAR